MGSFRMADGRMGELALLSGNRYALLAPGYRAPLTLEAGIRNPVVRGSESIGADTVVILTVATAGCPVQTNIAVLRPGAVLSWMIGDCRSLPGVTVDENRIQFDFAIGTPLGIRFTYADGKLDRQAMPAQALAPLTPPSAAPGRAPSSAPGRAGTAREPIRPPAARYTPGAPTHSPDPAAAAGQAPADAIAPDAPAARTTQRPAPARAASTAPTPMPRELSFPKQELKPVRIVLDQ
jgi:hypothetical protein